MLPFRLVLAPFIRLHPDQLLADDIQIAPQANLIESYCAATPTGGCTPTPAKSPTRLISAKPAGLGLAGALPVCAPTDQMRCHAGEIRLSPAWPPAGQLADLERALNLNFPSTN